MEEKKPADPGGRKNAQVPARKGLLLLDSRAKDLLRGQQLNGIVLIQRSGPQPRKEE